MSMKKQSASQSASFNPRVLIGFVLCSIGVLLASAGWSKAFAQISPTTASVPPDSKAAVFPASGAHANTDLTHKVIAAPQGTWGYDVFADGRLMIHQTSVPALPGNEGFKTKDGATKVSLPVIAKIKNSEMPPTISIDEMKNLNAIK